MSMLSANTVAKRSRCAIYTRKSSEEGLDMEFNSLDAQREACEAYVISQKAEGWAAIRERYDDGGFSGGTLDRPALKQLLSDIEAGLIDVIVVYKIDRLSRSLMDFAKLVEVFDRNNVTFVSVTQSFNTTTSMGRLTLNILLSFAQFEREVIGERIRDKFAASRKRGMWMGGFVPMGYDVKDRKLIINEDEAANGAHDLRAFRSPRLRFHVGARAASRAGAEQARQAASTRASSTSSSTTASISARRSTRGPPIPESMKRSSRRDSGTVCMASLRRAPGSGAPRTAAAPRHY